MPTVKQILDSAARRRGVTPEALKGFIAGITLMSYGSNITDEQFEQCLDLLTLNADDDLLNEALEGALNTESEDETEP
jgi:hypothetical protein